MPVIALSSTMKFFLPLAVAIFAGEAVAGEAGWGSLRYALAGSVSRSRYLFSKLVVALMFSVAAVVLVPMLRHPMRTTTFANEVPIDPYVPMTIPAVIPRSPDESWTRRRRDDHACRRRRDLDVDPDRREGGRHGAHEHRCRNNETNDRGIHFQSTSIH